MGDITRYTRADVAKRNGKEVSDVWIIYKDSVYDITMFVYEHPGGGEVIMDEAGTDSTKAFDSSGHTSDARTIMKKYKIGELVEEEKDYDANGKKKKKVQAAPEKYESRSCLNMVTCGLIG